MSLLLADNVETQRLFQANYSDDSEHWEGVLSITDAFL